MQSFEYSISLSCCYFTRNCTISEGTKKKEYLLRRTDEGTITKIPCDPPNDELETAQENAVKFSRFARPKNENIHAGKNIKLNGFMCNGAVLYLRT